MVRSKKNGSEMLLMNTKGRFLLVSLLMLMLMLPTVFAYSWGIKTAPPQVFNNQTNLTINDIMLHGELCFYNDGCINNITGVENGTIRLENYVPYVGANKTLQMGIENITFENGRLLVHSNLPDPLNPMIFVSNNNTNGTSFTRHENDVGGQIDIGVFGYEIGQAIFPGQIDVSDSAMGVSTRGGPIWLGTRNNESILFGGSPDDNLSNIDFSVKIDTELDALVFQGDKYIRPVRVDGGYGLLFQSTDVLHEGGFPFIWVAQDSNNETIVPMWQQNGRNNSFSGQMNSFGVVPNAWVNFGLSQPGVNDSAGVEFLFNTSDYVKYCAWLQINLSLVPEGCKYFADTAGRGVPLMFAGDFEVHRTATIHESLTVFNDLDFIGRNGNDADFFFNGGNGGKLHARDNRALLENVTSINRTLCNFDDATLCGFVVESIAPEPGRDWTSVLEAQCHEDRCANAKGGNLKIMSLSDGTQNADNINISFWITTLFSIGDSFYVTLDDNLGNVTTILTETVTILDEERSFIMPDIYENKTNITTTFYLDGQNANRQVWVDNVHVYADFSEQIEINDPYEGGRIVLGEDRGNLSCAIDVNKFLNNETFESEWQISLGSPDCAVDFVGNVTFTDSTVINQTVVGDSTITGNLTVGGDISQNGVLLDDTYVPYTGADSDLNMGFNNIITASDISLTGSSTQTLNIGDEIVANLYELEMGVSGTLAKIESYASTGLNIRASYPGGPITFNAGGDITFDADGDIEMGDSDITTTGVATSGQGVFGANTLLGLSDGDINVSTVYYDTLSPKSPHFVCPQDDTWCFVVVPKYQQFLWLEKDDDWNIIQIVKDDVSYTSQEFNSQVCPSSQKSQGVCDELITKYNRLKSSDSCKKDGYQWDYECYEIIKQPVSRDAAVEGVMKDVTRDISSICEMLNIDLEVETYTCTETVTTIEQELVWEFKEECGWDNDTGFYCDVRMVI